MYCMSGPSRDSTAYKQQSGAHTSPRERISEELIVWLARDTRVSPSAMLKAVVTHPTTQTLNNEMNTSKWLLTE